MPGKAPIEIKITEEDGAKLHETAVKLKKLGDGKTIPKEFRKALRVSALPLVAKTRTAAMDLPSKNKSQSHLRQRIAASVGVKIGTGHDPMMAIVIRKARLGEQARLPKLMNKGNWNHPVFGDTNTWEPEASRRGWFDNVMIEGTPFIQAALDETVREFERRFNL